MYLDVMWETIEKRLEGQFVVLEPLRPEHADALRGAGADTAIWSLMFVGDIDAWLEHTFREPSFVPFATLLKGVPVGSSSYLSLAPEHRRLEIGNTWLAPSAWGSGANVEAKLLMLRHAFEDLGCLRVEFKTDAKNERSRAALAALPARFEGIHRQHMLVRGGERRDSAWYSVVDDEWPAVRANLERRLGSRAGTSK
jgi:RimJ/RimL family protein N-acetyltransferase